MHHAGKGGTWIGALPKAGTAASGGGTGHSPFGDSERSNTCEQPLSAHAVGAQELFASCGLGALVEGPADTERRLWPELTRTPRGLRRVRTGYAYQPPALGTYRRRRAACPQGPTYCTYWVRVPASGVRYVPRTAVPQVVTHPLAPDDELTIDYLANGDAEDDGSTQATRRRRKWLRTQYGFDCRCERCHESA